MNPTPFSDLWIDESLDEINALCNGDHTMTRETLIEILDTSEAKSNYLSEGGHTFALHPKETEGGPTAWADGQEVQFRAEKGAPLKVRDPETLKMEMPATIRAQNAIGHEDSAGWGGMFLKGAQVEAWDDNSTVSITLHTPHYGFDVEKYGAGVAIVMKPSEKVDKALDAMIVFGTKDAPEQSMRMDYHSALFELAVETYRAAYPSSDVSRSVNPEQAREASRTKGTASRSAGQTAQPPAKQVEAAEGSGETTFSTEHFNDKWVDESLRDINAVCKDKHKMTRENLVDLLDAEETLASQESESRRLITIEADRSIHGEEHVFEASVNSQLLEFDPVSGVSFPCADTRGYRHIQRDDAAKRGAGFLVNAKSYVETSRNDSEVGLTLHNDTMFDSGVKFSMTPSKTVEGALDVTLGFGDRAEPDFDVRVPFDSGVFALCVDTYRATYPWADVSRGVNPEKSESNEQAKTGGKAARRSGKETGQVATP